MAKACAAPLSALRSISRWPVPSATSDAVMPAPAVLIALRTSASVAPAAIVTATSGRCASGVKVVPPASSAPMRRRSVPPPITVALPANAPLATVWRCASRATSIE